MITFVGNTLSGSSKIRGYQILSQIRESNFYDINKKDFSNKNNKFHKHIIFIKNIELNLLEKLKNEHPDSTFYLDVVDSTISTKDYKPHGKNTYKDFLPLVKSKEFFDFYITTNSLMKKDLNDELDILFEKMITIPHHCISICDEEYIERILKKKDIKNAGYIGLDSQFYKKNEIKEILKNKNIEFLTSNPSDPSQVIKNLKSLDVGIIYLEKDKWSDRILRLKPNEKLTNFQAFGIPTLTVKYRSFEEFGDNAFIEIQTVKDINEKIQQLLDDKKLRDEIINKGYENAKRYSLKEISNLYLKMICGEHA